MKALVRALPSADMSVANILRRRLSASPIRSKWEIYWNLDELKAAESRQPGGRYRFAGFSQPSISHNENIVPTNRLFRYEHDCADIVPAVHVTSIDTYTSKARTLQKNIIESRPIIFVVTVPLFQNPVRSDS